MYNVLDEVFINTMKRERKIISTYHSKEEFECFFRRNSDRNNHENKLTIFYTTNAPVNIGTLVVYKNSVFIAINKESTEGTIYFKSDLLEATETILFSGDTTEALLPCHLNSKGSALLGNGSTISIADNKIELITELNEKSNSVAINDTFKAFGYSYKVTFNFKQNGISYISAEYVFSSTEEPIYSLALNLLDEYELETTIIPEVVAMKDSNTIKNPTIEFSSTDNEIAQINEDNTISFIAEGSVTIIARWVEHDIIQSKEIFVKGEEVAGTVEFTYDSNPTIRAGLNSFKYFTAIFKDGKGNEVSDIVANWTLDLTSEQENAITTDLTGTNSIGIKSANVSSIVGTNFDLHVTDENNLFIGTLNIRITSIYGY